MWCHLKLRKSWHKFKTNLIILMWTSSDLNECSILLAYFGTSLLLSHYGNMTRLSLLFNGNHLVFVFFFIFIYNGQKSCAICARLGILLMSLAIVKKKEDLKFFIISRPLFPPRAWVAVVIWLHFLIINLLSCDSSSSNHLCSEFCYFCWNSLILHIRIYNFSAR